MRLLSLLALFVITACATGLDHDWASPADTAVHEIFLVRHAEKQAGKNPSLTEAGQDRAKTLADLLSTAGLTHIHSTDYMRTRETAAPLAAQTGLAVHLYDASDADAFADQLRSVPGVHLVVGHSNTIPGLVEALGGAPGDAIDEATEYDRLYIVDLSAKSPKSRLERYGVLYEKPVSDLVD